MRGRAPVRGWFRGRGFRGGFRGNWRGRGRGRRGGRRPATLEPGFPKRCEICDTTLQSKFELEKHKIGKRHLKNLRKDEILKQQKANGSKSDDAKSTKDSKHISVNTEKACRLCTLCQVEFTSDHMENDHMKGARHLTNVRKAAMGEVVKVTKKKKPRHKFGKCDLCAVIYTSQVMMDTHIYGRRHKINCRKKNLPIPTRPNKRNLDELSTTTVTMPAAQKTTTSATVTTVPKVLQYQILEKKAEEAYEHYLEVAKANPDDAAGNQAIYIKYQEIYKTYERAYARHVRELTAEGSV